MRLSIDVGLKKKCPSLALGCVAGHVKTGDSPLELLGEMDLCEAGVLKKAEGRFENQQRMSKRMIADHVPGAHQFTHNVWPLASVASDQKKCSAYIVLGENL